MDTRADDVAFSGVTGDADAIDEQWRSVEPLLDTPEQPSLYTRGTWGPAQADLLAGGWHELHAQHGKAG